MTNRFETALERFDQANQQDPNKEWFEGNEVPKEWLYGRRMSAWLEKLAPQASEVLQLAARSQHLRRWEIPRSQYPMDRTGYLKWRTELKNFHAEKAADILREAGYEKQVIDRVQELLRKQNLKTDPEMQLLEDVICLVFLEHYFASFSSQHDKEKIVSIVKKTWNKMSPAGHEAALQISIPPEAQALVQEALGK